MFVGTLACDLLLGDVRSLKQKRGTVRPVVAELRRRFDVAVAEVGHLDLYRRTQIGVAVVATDMRRCADVLDAVERHVAARPELELLSTRRRFHGDHDDHGDDLRQNRGDQGLDLGMRGSEEETHG